MKKYSQNVLKEIVDFHELWSNLEERKHDILFFTIREIEATINTIANGENITESILSIYGSRYKFKEYEKLKNMLSKYHYLNSNEKNNELLFNSEFLFQTPSLKNVLKSINLSFDNNRHIMIAGDEGTGKSQIAKYFVENREKKNEDSENTEMYYCQCTGDIKCSLIGNQYPSFSSSNESSQINERGRWIFNSFYN